MPVAWIARYAALEPWIRRLEKNAQGQDVVDAHIYVDVLAHLYVVAKT